MNTTEKNKTVETISCGCGLHSRRAFLTNCAKCLGSVGAFSGLAVPSILATSGCTPGRIMKVRVVFVLHAPVQDRPDWPNIGFDFNPVMEEIMNALTKGCPKIEFVRSIVNGVEKAEKLKASDQAAEDIDGYIVTQINCWNHAVQQLNETGKPLLYADFLYAGSGEFLVYTARQLSANKRFFPAKAAYSGNKVYVFSPAVTEPVAVRYCWDNISATELFTVEGNLPVASFRTDDW